MKKSWKKKISVILILSMAFTMSIEAQATEDLPDITTEESMNSELESAEMEPDVSDMDSMGQESVSSEVSDSDLKAYDASEADKDSSEISALDENVNSEEDQESTEDKDYDTYELNLLYDDRYSFADFQSVDLTDYELEEITTVSITSNQVSGGKSTDIPDEYVVILNDSSDGFIATGVGTAEILFKKNDDESEIKLSVTVSAAPLSILLIAGQSNAEGTCSSNTGSHPEDSVMCKEGQVYSTYAPSASDRGERNTGISGIGECTAENAGSYVADSLTSETSRAGSTLTYPLNALTESGNGKTGMDSGLAYNWNRLTGTKVWVVNAAWSATSITKWIPGGTYYDRAVAVFQGAVSTAKEEVLAGHYSLEHTLLFWLQGEDDLNMSTSNYLTFFLNMYNGFENENLGIQNYGIIIVRACIGSYVNSEDIYMTGPRIAQYSIGNDPSYSKIYVASNANEQWVSDSGVKSYFQNAYGSSLNYPLRSGANIGNSPTTVAEVHNDIHYSQLGHNENGLTAAETMYEVVYNKAGSVSSICWYDENGTQFSGVTEVSVTKNGNYTFVPVVMPLSRSKEINVVLDGEGYNYDTTTAILTTPGAGNGTLTAEIGDTNSKLNFTMTTTEKLSTPVLESATADASGTTISWDSVPGAVGYAVYREESGGTYTMIDTTTSTSYTDKESLTGGSTYYYTVRAYKGTKNNALANKYDDAYWSGYESPGLKAVYLSTPSLSSATTNAASTTTISWGKVSGASGYAVYRMLSGGGWSMIDTTTSTSYTDNSSLTSGQTYYYTVRAYYGDVTISTNNKYNAAYWSGYNTIGLKNVYLSNPSVTATAGASGTELSWKSISGASGYAVYREISGGSYEMIATTSSTSTSYTDKDSLKGGSTYYYTVRAFTGDATTAKNNKYNAAYWGGYNSGVKSVYLSVPSLSSATTNSASTTTISWGKVSGASGYAVYRVLSGGGWSMIDTTTSTSYTDKSSLTSGQTYYYTVRAYYGNESTAKNNKYDAAYWSGFDTIGLKNVYLTNPSVTATAGASGTELSWKSISSASGYAVYREISGGSYEMIATTSSTSYTDKESLSGGKTYYYTVRAYTGDATTAKNNKYNAAYWGGYNSGVKSVYLAVPTLKSASSAATGTTVSWGSVSGASGYAIYRMLSGGGWSMIDTTTSTSYTDKVSLTSGETYYYTVRAYYGNVTTAKNNKYNAAYWGGFNTTGLKNVYLSNPSVTATAGASGTELSWKSISGASGYAVYREISGGTYEMIATTSSTSYTDKESLNGGKTYYYTVRAYTGDATTAKNNKYNAAYWGGYNSGVKSVYLAVPKLSSATSVSSGVKVSWDSVSGASGYAVYRRTSGGSWTMIATTTSTSYTDTASLTIGTTYDYTVRAYYGNVTTAQNNKYNAAYWSGFDAGGLSIEYSSN